MENRKSNCVTAFFLLVVFVSLAHSQQDHSKSRRAFRITTKVTASLVKAGARAALEGAKFAGRNIVVPAFKEVGIPVVKAAPPLIAKAAKLSAKGVKYGLKVLSNNGRHDRTTDDDKRGAEN